MASDLNNVSNYGTVGLFSSEAAQLPEFVISCFYLFYKVFLSTVYSSTLNV